MEQQRKRIRKTPEHLLDDPSGLPPSLRHGLPGQKLCRAFFSCMERVSDLCHLLIWWIITTCTPQVALRMLKNMGGVTRKVRHDITSAVVAVAPSIGHLIAELISEERAKIQARRDYDHRGNPDYLKYRPVLRNYDLITFCTSSFSRLLLKVKEMADNPEHYKGLHRQIDAECKKVLRPMTFWSPASGEGIFALLRCLCACVAKVDFPRCQLIFAVALPPLLDECSRDCVEVASAMQKADQEDQEDQ